MIGYPWVLAWFDVVLAIVDNDVGYVIGDNHLENGE
jgi:hypothetical protein